MTTVISEYHVHDYRSQEFIKITAITLFTAEYNNYADVLFKFEHSSDHSLPVTKIKAIRFIPLVSKHRDITCDANGTRISINNHNALWKTVLINVLFDQKKLYYFECVIEHIDECRLIMIGMVNEKRYDPTCCLFDGRMYCADTCMAKVRSGAVVGIYVDLRTSANCMYAFVDGTKCATIVLNRPPLIPSVSLANTRGSVRLIPKSFRQLGTCSLLS
jgi:hypothetical protein